MFKDELFNRARKYVRYEITQEEANLYATDKIRKVYSSLEELLLDNISYYNRIIRSILVFYENRVYEYGLYVGSIEKTKYSELMTPTRLYYLILMQPDFNRYEILIGYPQLKDIEGNNFKELLPHLTRIGSFNFLASYTNTKFRTRSYTKGLNLDTTQLEYINKVLDVKTVCYIDKNTLAEDFEKVHLIKENTDGLDKIISGYIRDKSKTLCSFTPSSFNISNTDYSSNLTYHDGSLQRNLSGSFKKAKRLEIFISSKLEDIGNIFNENSILLKSLGSLYTICGSMIQYFGSDFICYRVDSNGCYSSITLKKFWNNRRLIETFYNETGQPVHIQTRIFGKLIKTVDYIVGSGYFVYGDQNNKRLNLLSVAKTSNYKILFENYEEHGATTLATTTSILSLISLQNDRIIQAMTGVNNH